MTCITATPVKDPVRYGSHRIGPEFLSSQGDRETTKANNSPHMTTNAFSLSVKAQRPWYHPHAPATSNT